MKNPTQIYSQINTDNETIEKCITFVIPSAVKESLSLKGFLHYTSFRSK